MTASSLDLPTSIIYEHSFFAGNTSKRGSASSNKANTSETKIVFKDKKEALEAVKDLLREYVSVLFSCKSEVVMLFLLELIILHCAN